MRKFRFILLFWLVIPAYINAQVVEMIQIDTSTNQIKGGADFFNQASIGMNGSNTSVTLKTIKLSAMIGNSEHSTPWDLYLFNSVNAFSIQDSDRIDAVGKDLLNQIGGVFNIALAKTGYFAYEGKPDLKGVKGGVCEFRIGARAVDIQNRVDDKKFLVPLIQSTADVRYLIPLVDNQDRHNRKSDIKSRMKGNLSFRTYVGYIHVFENQPSVTEVSEYYSKNGTLDGLGGPYYRTFRVMGGLKDGYAPPTDIMTFNFEANLFITNAFYISFGYTSTYDVKSLGYQSRVPGSKTFFSISYSGVSNK